ncbi:MAG: hypothetical protein V1841_00620, partial [Patescibacteria group bacterium]
FKNWEAGVRAWAKGAGGQYVTPIDTDDVHTTENQPQISVLEAPHKDALSKYILFSIGIVAPQGVKKVEVWEVNPTERIILTTSANKTEYSFKFTIESLGESENYKFKIIVTDKVGNKATKIIQ